MQTCQILLQVCGTTPCRLNGSQKIVETLENHLGIHMGQTTPDGMFTLGEMECMGCCVNAPMIVVADFSKGVDGYSYNYYEDLTPDDAIRVADTYKSGAWLVPSSLFLCIACTLLPQHAAVCSSDRCLLCQRHPSQLPMSVVLRSQHALCVAITHPQTANACLRALQRKHTLNLRDALCRAQVNLATAHCKADVLGCSGIS